MIKHHKLLQILCCAITLFTSLFSSGCQQQPTLPGSSSLQLEVVKEITLSPEVAEHLGNVVDRIPASPSEDLLALTNARSPIHIVVVDYNGDLVEVVGSEGRGPEELLWPRYFGFDQENNIVVYDNDLALFKVFKHSSGSVSSYSPPSIQDMQIKGEGYFEGTCKDKWYILTSSFSGIIDDSTPIVGIFSKEFELLHTMGRYDPLFVERSETRSVMRSPTLQTDCERKVLYTSHVKVPFIQVYSMNDQSLIHRTEAMPPSFKLSDTFVSTVYDFAAHQEFRRDEQSTNMIVSHNEHYVITSFFNNTTEFIETRDSLTRNYFLAVYDRETYSFIGELPVEGTIAGTTRQGYLIEIIDDNPENFTIRFLDIQPVTGG
ncbi:MAG TPA: hypothetical protein VK040_06650 [Balneolaceae bacterium]|nr:hypothetical protein [Balneolaceae bacterium]